MKSVKEELAQYAENKDKKHLEKDISIVV